MRLVHIYVRLICINIFDGRDQNKDFENCVSKKVEKEFHEIVNICKIDEL